MTRRYPAMLLLLTLALPFTQGQSAPSAAPHLEKRGAATQLIVDAKPFLMLAGELHNSSSSSLAYMQPLWPQLAAMHLNTVLTPLSWELIEPEEGQFDFALVDGLIAQAQQAKEHIVFLWLASYKNGMSSYPPAWVKRDTARFPRVVIDGRATNILSPMGEATMQADARAFAALMHHLRVTDTQHTVLMLQVENEVGVLGATRDHSAKADRAFADPVPPELMRALVAHHAELSPELSRLWEQNGTKTAGSWEQVFGASARADEIFMAWQYARFVQGIAAAGKAAYPLPLYVNTWLGGTDSTPGEYPSGGPQPRVVDIWKAAGDAIDLYAPDLYAADFAGWAERYHRQGNPLFIPETNGGAAGAAGAFYAVGEHQALGISPFGIDAYLPGGSAVKNDPDQELPAAYEVLGALSPILLAATAPGATHAFELTASHPSVEFEMNGYTVDVSLDQLFGHHSEAGYGLLVATGPDTFLGAGKGFRVGFTVRQPGAPRVGIATIDEDTYAGGTLVAGRRLNGDESDQGQYWRFDQRTLHVERVKLYRFN